MKHTFALLIMLGFSLGLFAQKGSIKGVVTDKKTAETIVGANVVIQGTTIGSATDLDGNFLIANVTPGVYNLVVSFISYKTKVIEKVKVTANQATEIKIEIEENTTTIEGVVVTATRSTSSDISVLTSIKSSELVANGVSAQLIQRSQDRDASEVIRRIPGITIIDNRFVMVRGLSERYNEVWLNKSATPSSETDVKAFSFDVIPSSMLDNIMVYKTAAPNLPASFAGAAIEVYTKNDAEKNSVSLGYSSSLRQGTTFESFYKYSGGKYDWLGIDDGTRKLSSDFPSFIDLQKMSKADLATWGKKLNRNWTSSESQSKPDQRFQGGFTTRFRAGKFSIGNITSINYSNTNQFNDITRASFQLYDTIKDKPTYEYNYNEKQYTQTAKVGVLHNWLFVYGNNQKIEFRNLLNQIGWTRTNFREGTDYYVGTDGRQEKSYEMRFNSRTTFSSQLSGINKLRGDKAKFTWVAGYSIANKSEPDVKRITSFLNKDPDSQHYNKYGVSINFAASPEHLGRVYSDVNEDLVNAAANWEQIFTIGKMKPELRAGFYLERKKREFSTRLLGYRIATSSQFRWDIPYWSLDAIFADSTINPKWGIILDDKTSAADSYESENNLNAFYLAAKIPVTPMFIVSGGVRAEQNSQKLSSFRKDDPTKPVKYDNDTLNLFPSVNIFYNLSEKSLLRFAFGLTVNRPEFREIAPLYFYDFELKASVHGNDSLRNAYIHNYDFRFELYPSKSETFSLGLFYKRFIDPIETYVVPAGSGLAYTFDNAAGSKSMGAEMELRKSFAETSKKIGWLKWARDINILLNASYIYSRVEFAEGQLEEERPMQGQSPYIVNAGVFYQNDSLKLMVSLLYNVIGKRVVFVGDPYTSNPDIYELERHLLDLTITKQFGKHFQIKGGVQDLLQQKVRYVQTVKFNQDKNGDGVGDGIVTRTQTTMSFRPGRYITLGFVYNF